ncbi:MAG: hypothetical protein JWP62_1375, partial [Blastococcus sp.]|nr:hypothetical protein [Blastococcus sp.]
MANLESLRRFGLVLELAEAAGDGDWAGWAKVLGGLDEDTRADVVRQSSLVIAMLCDREAERRGITRDQFLAQFRAEAMDHLGCSYVCGRGHSNPHARMHQFLTGCVLFGCDCRCRVGMHCARH